jgi:energy-coupling factor transporter transmembrane protein EcfT
MISRLTKFIIVLFFSAMALVEIDIATQIVIIGYTTIMITLGIIFVILALAAKQSILGEIIHPNEKNFEN